MYPFKITINDPELGLILQRLQHNHSVRIPSRAVSNKLTWKLRPIRPDIVLGPDSRYRETHLSLSEGMDIEVFKKGNRFDIIFKKLF